MTVRNLPASHTALHIKFSKGGLQSKENLHGDYWAVGLEINDTLMTPWIVQANGYLKM